MFQNRLPARASDCLSDRGEIERSGLSQCSVKIKDDSLDQHVCGTNTTKAPRNTKAGLFSGPGRKGVLDSGENSAEFGVMSLQNGYHVVLIDPVEARLGVDLGTVIDREEPVTLQAACRHEDKNSEGSFAESESLSALVPRTTRPSDRPYRYCCRIRAGFPGPIPCCR